MLMRGNNNNNNNGDDDDDDDDDVQHQGSQIFLYTESKLHYIHYWDGAVVDGGRHGQS
jgi:hypothetical protein